MKKETQPEFLDRVADIIENLRFEKLLNPKPIANELRNIAYRIRSLEK